MENGGSCTFFHWTVVFLGTLSFMDDVRETRNETPYGNKTSASSGYAESKGDKNKTLDPFGTVISCIQHKPPGGKKME
jgi:hypothetical protein